MRVIVANFGLHNWAWPGCLRRGTVAVMDDDRVHGFYLAGDREGYIRAAQKHLHAPGAPPPARNTASRWYGTNTLLLESDGDLWLHKDGDKLWWTTSTGAEASHEIVDEPEPRHGGPVRSHFYQKPCTGWSDHDRKGRTLHWKDLHLRARDFLNPQSTFSPLRPDGARYMQALIAGEDLSPWHSRADWLNKRSLGGKVSGTVLDVRRRTVARIAMTVMGTVEASGSTSVVTRKNKEFGFPTQAALETYIDQLMEANELVCALTGLIMQLDDGDDPALRVSLDRIDSSGHYAPGNLQLVCRFANRWKSDNTDGEFRRLLALVRDVADAAPEQEDGS